MFFLFSFAQAHILLNIGFSLCVTLCVYSTMPTHACEYPGCAYTAQKKALLTLHTRTHTKETPYACEHPGCEYRARQRCHLVVHQATHSEDRPYACAVAGCAYTSKSRSGLSVHAKAVHGEGEVLHCPHCVFKSVMPKALSEHINAHLGIKPYTCQLCGFATTYSSHYSAHCKKCKGKRRGLLLPGLAAAALEAEQAGAGEEAGAAAEEGAL